MAEAKVRCSFTCLNSVVGRIRNISSFPCSLSFLTYHYTIVTHMLSSHGSYPAFFFFPSWRSVMGSSSFGQVSCFVLVDLSFTEFD